MYYSQNENQLNSLCLVAISWPLYSSSRSSIISQLLTCILQKIRATQGILRITGVVFDDFLDG